MTESDSQALFVQNILPKVSDDEIYAVFARFGEVADIQRPFDRFTMEPRKFAFVVMQTTQGAEGAVESLNGYDIAGQKIIVQKVDPNKQAHKIDYRMIKEVGSEIADELQETDPRPRGQIMHILEEMGEEFTRQLLADTFKVQEEGGMDIEDGSRKRTTGGVFFKLAKDRLDPKTRGRIFPRPDGKSKKVKKSAQNKKGQKGQKSPKSQKGQKGGGKQRGKAPGNKMTTPTTEQIRAAAQVASTKQPRELTPEIRAEYTQLKAAEATAQTRLADIQTKKVKGSPIAALKELADIKAKIAQLMKTYPGLKQ